MTRSRQTQAVIALLVIAAVTTTARAQGINAPMQAATPQVLASTLNDTLTDAARLRAADRAALGASRESTKSPPAPLPRRDRTSSTWKGIGIGALVGGAAGYLMFSGKDEDEDDLISAIHEGVALEAGILGAGLGAVIGGIIGYIRGRP